MDAVSSPTAIEIRGACTNNLKNIDLDVPHGQFTVITGVSGSGKSSLAFDTLYAEGQRQFLQGLSSYTRQFVDQMQRPQVASIRGLQPSLCIDQQSGTLSPRSTVGTITEIYDYLRLLMARVAIPACHQCGRPIDRMPMSVIVQSMSELAIGTKLTVLAPMVLGRKGSHADVFDRIGKAGLVRARVDGEFVELESLPVLSPRRTHTIAAVVDRLVVREDCRERLENAISVALRLSDGLVSSHTVQTNDRDEIAESERLYSTRYACVHCGISLPEIEPRSFSFNSPYGACPRCEGFGFLEKKVDEVCPDCNGQRLRPESLSIRLAGYSIAEITRLPLLECHQWLQSLNLSDRQTVIARPIVLEIAPRLEYLARVGLGYLSLDRPGASLSGGELQRVRLATSVGTGLIGVCYVLDEPSIGLHPRDTHRLVEILRSLQSQGNTIVVVEHDEQIMRAADLLVDVGPGAGRDGGEILLAAPPAEFDSAIEGAPHTAMPHNAMFERSLTAQYLSHSQAMPRSRHRTVPTESPVLEICGVTLHNLIDVSARIPLGRLVGITGVSGSGKSTLVHDSVVNAVAASLSGSDLPTHVRSLHGIDPIDKLIEIDQTPIGRSPRSIPATYCGVWDHLRKLYASTRDAKQRGYAASRFSFNSGNGRCDACGGQGRQRIEMSFLEDVSVVCPRCRGQRFNPATLAVRFKDKNLADVLAMSVDEAAEFFENVPRILSSFLRLQQVGLGYLILGQSSNTLSGGEAQRLKLANELSRPETGKSLYVLDEPTTGLHMHDVARLIDVLQGLVDRGNTVVVVEHQMDLIACCDWVIDMGPDAGNSGGQIIGAGPPETIAGLDTPTGCALGKTLGSKRFLN